MAKYRILSLDGGGIRGLLSLILLQRLGLNSQLEGWLERADLLAGTSTGGLIALGLAHGVSSSVCASCTKSKDRLSSPIAC